MNYPENSAYDTDAPFNQDEPVKVHCDSCEDGFSYTSFRKVKSPCRECLGTCEVDE